MKENVDTITKQLKIKQHKTKLLTNLFSALSVTNKPQVHTFKMLISIELD